MIEVQIRTKAIPATPRSKNYPIGATVIKGGGNRDIDISSKLDSLIFYDYFSKVNVGSEENPHYAIKSNYDFFSGGEISAGGLDINDSGTSGATALYQLVDISPNETGDGVLGASKGKVLTYDGSGHWYAGDAVGLDEAALKKYLTDNKYTTQSWIEDKGYITRTVMNAALANKVDVVSGKGLSTNDFTNALLNKLNGIAEGANKYILPVAKAAILGGVMVGSTLTASAEGVLNLSGVGKAGTYTKVTTDGYGRVINGYSLSASDIPALDISKITGLQIALDNKLDKATFESFFAKDENGNIYVVNGVNFYTNGEISAGGVASDGGGGGVVSALYQLLDVTPNELGDGVLGAIKGNVLTYDGTHWYAAKAGMDEAALKKYLTDNNYAKNGKISFGSLTGKPTTIAGYGITDAVNSGNISLFYGDMQANWYNIKATILGGNEFNFVTNDFVGGLLHINYRAITSGNNISAGLITGYQFDDGRKGAAGVRLYASNGIATSYNKSAGVSRGVLGAGRIELQHATPYIDFCFGSGTSVTSQLIESTSGTLQFTKNLLVSGDTYFGNAIYWINAVGKASLAKVIVRGEGNTYTTGGLEVRGNGTTSAYPLIGFHQPNIAGGCLFMMHDGNFKFIDSTLSVERSVFAQSFIGRNARFNTCLAYYNGSAATVTGTICITLPNGFNSSMNLYEIDIYEYTADTTRNNATITIGGYNYSGDSSWINHGYRTSGGYNKGVRLAYNGSKCVILLGTTSTTWSYPQVFLRQVLTGFSSQTTWASGYSITILTSESGLSKISNPPLASQYFGTVTARDLSVSGAAEFKSGINISGGSASFTNRIYANGGIRANIGGTEDWGAIGVFAGADTYPLCLFGRNGGTNTRKYYFSTGTGSLNLSSANDANNYIAGIATFYHAGATNWHGDMSVRGEMQLYKSLSVVSGISAGGTIKTTAYLGFFNEVGTGTYSFMRLKSGTVFWDLAIKDTETYGGFQLRYNGQPAYSYVFETTTLRTGTNNIATLGVSSYRWGNVYSIDGNFSGKLTIGDLNANRIGISNASSTTGYGISLYGGVTTGMPTYGIAFAGTGSFGTHGIVTGDWATYLTMSDTNNRGWIFKRGSTNVASIDGTGSVAYNGWLRNMVANQGMYSATGDARWYYNTSRAGWYGDKQIISTNAFHVYNTTFADYTYSTALSADWHVSKYLGANGSYAYEVILLMPVMTVVNESNTNKIQGRFIFCTNGANQYGYIDLMVQCNYNTIISSIESGESRTGRPFVLATCKYDGIKYLCLKVPYSANRWDNTYFYGTLYSSKAGGNAVSTKPKNLPLLIKYKTVANGNNAEVINNAEINNSLTDNLIVSPITSHTTIQKYVQHHFSPYMNNTMDLGAAAYRWRYVYGVNGNFNGTLQATDGLITYGTLSVSGTSTFTGRATFNGGANIGYTNTSYQLSTNTFISNDWVRTNGATGWYSQTYGGGVFMSDNTYVRIYGGKRFFVPNAESTDFSHNCAISTDGGIHASKNITTDGYIAAKGEVSAGATSDRRLKKNFSNEDYQQRVLDLGSVKDFEYREKEMKRGVRPFRPGRHTSLIAQDIRSCSSMVSKEKDGYLSINNLDPDFMFTVVGAVQLNVLGLRLVKSEVQTLKDEIKTLKGKIKKLEGGL